MYNPVNPKADFPAQENIVLKFWKDKDIFKKSVLQREGSDEFVFYDGPPFATGLPHFGHFIPSTIKDIIPRYQTMKGKKVERRFGWDCHGLPVENLIEKELGLNSKTDIEKYGIEKFNDACRASVLRYTSQWRQIITRMGRWVDFDNDYKTMEADYMESIWWVVKTLWDKKMIYEGHYILPYCPRCSTVLSNHELSLGGYKDVYDPAVTLRFKITRAPESINDSELTNGRTYFLAWTTTPWTLPSNLGLAVGPDIDYVKVKDGDDFYILAESRLSAYYKSESEYKIIRKYKGLELAGAKYEPLFPYFSELTKNKDGSDGAFRVFTADFVSTEDGTGIVHTAPGFGEEDNKVFKGTGIPTVCPIDGECKFTSEVPDYEGRFVKDCDKDIIERLKREKKLVKRDQILHSYPHCWRCSHPLIYRAVGSWFVKVEEERENLLKANSRINWQPAHIKEGRFGKWLEGARDWAVSRNRYWGNPIPIWKCEECGKTLCVGSRDELKELSGVYPEDLHKQFVDKINIPCSCGKTMRRIPEVLDCWFESGAMPYAQNHYPFENKEYFERHFPADFISEGLDQTRGWFYTLTVLASNLLDRPAFKNCIVSGLVLASDGKKMSKSLRNYTDPVEAINQFGADAIRLFLMHSAVVKADDLRYSDDGVRDVLKSIIIPLWNSYSFFVTYANIDKILPTGRAFDLKLPENPLDRWMLSVTQQLVKKVTDALDSYDLSGAIDPIVLFIDLMNNWYIRRSRRRFWKSENDADKSEAYETLYIALKTFTKVASPVIPFITEQIWQNLKLDGDKESVHLEDYPEYNGAWRDEALEFKMSTVQKAVSMGRSLRNEFNLKNRQPLASVALITKNPEEKAVLSEMEDSIKEELNVKKVVFHEREDELVEYKAKANFRVLGKELGPLMKQASQKIEQLGQDAVQSIMEGANLSIEIEGKIVELTAEKIIVDRIEKEGMKVINDGTLTVGLDAKISDELRKEGYVRDLVRGIQNLRKESGLEVTDRIILCVSGSEDLKAAYEMFGGFIAGETLAVKTLWKDSLDWVEIEADDKIWRVSLEKA
ncbi:isoleucine--tRNA ligase [Treponema parvum]|uniref:Isoleucine--tRNA ligase n=1 Tax=Treponema parvum TaxID=138851 RepID=A0A975F466_9SPIR|nr:isoleucine--tRNA ligase [Treponema parvum]QTQ14126.1 isoleucine--tRNA ligase [Treponema parvum]